MDDDTLKTALIGLCACGLFVAFVYMSWQSRVQLRQMRAFPEVLQAAGFRLFSNPTLHESYRFLTEFRDNLNLEKTLYAATKREGSVDFTVFVYAERRSRATHPNLVLIATLPGAGPTGCIYTRRTPFGPITPAGHRVFKTNSPELDKAFRITTGSDSDFQALITPNFQQFLLHNQDLTQVEIAQNVIAIFTPDNRFFKLTTLNGIPSPEVFSQRLQQLRTLQNLLTPQFHD